jgi:Ca-activated chloride channel family protein
MTDQPAVSMRARADRQFIRPNDRSHRFVLVELLAPPATQARRRPPVNLAFVIDRSGSMSGQKLELAKSAVLEAIERLDGRDRFSVVVYDDDVQVVVERTMATSTARRDATDRLRDLGPGGSTNLSGGWFAGCEQVAARQDADAVNRVLLLTDGLANVGITDIGELRQHAAELQTRGISTTTFGVGNDFDETLLQSMADAGGGHFYYIADAAQIRDHIASEVGETLEVVARDVTLDVIPADGVRVEAISPQRVSDRRSRVVLSVGDLVADQAVEVVLRLTFPYGDLGRDTRVMFELGGASERLLWTYADDPTNNAQPRERDVDRAVARQFAARARQEAVQRNRGGDFIHARLALDATAVRIRKYTHGDAELRELTNALEREAAIYAAPVAEPNRKQAHFASANLARSRDAMGRSLRRNS